MISPPLPFPPVARYTLHPEAAGWPLTRTAPDEGTS
jgi:hypothetical protein